MEVTAETKNSSDIVIRPATPEDASIIYKYVMELAVYEKAQEEVKTDVNGLRDTIFCQDSPARAVICEKDGVDIGFAVFFYNYSTWLGKKGLYLEDLYVTPSQRGIGAGKKLLHYLANLALAEGCGRFEWSCLDWNTPALDFYHAQGAVGMEEWTVQRLAGQALIDFAKKEM